MFFSIITPAYRAEKYIEQAVASVAGQSFSNWEMLIVDDGSDDRTSSIADALVASEPRIRIMHRTHEGAQRARSAAIAEAGGEYLLFLDADDSFFGGALERIHSLLLMYPCDMLLFGMLFCDGETRLSAMCGEYPQGYVERDRFFPRMIDERITKSLGRKAVRRELVAFPDGFMSENAVNYGEDLLQTMAFLAHTEKIFNTNLLLEKYTRRANGAMNSFYDKKYLDKLTLYRAIYHYGRAYVHDALRLAALADTFLLRQIADCVDEISASGLSARERTRLLVEIARNDRVRDVMLRRHSLDLSAEKLRVLEGNLVCE